MRASLVGVRFQRGGRVYYLDAMGMDLQVNDRVVVETEEGPKVGQVVIAPHQVIHSDIKEPLKRILRKATEEE